jgi:formate dehydrogenase iron-sulfur subunit
MAVRIYVSRDAAAQALGADETAAALQVAGAAKGTPITLTRVGSRGMVWLEPLIEVEDASGQRIAYGPVTADDGPAWCRRACSTPRPPLRLGASRTCPGSRSRSA